MKKLLLCYHNMDFQKKMLLWFLALALFPLITIGAFSFFESLHNGRERYQSDLTFDLNNTMRMMYTTRREAELSGIKLASDPHVIEIILQDPKHYAVGRSFQLEQILYDYRVRSVADATYIYDGSEWYSNDLGRSNEALNQQLVRYLSKAKEGETGYWESVMETEGGPRISFVRTITDYQTGRQIGLVVVQFNTANLIAKTKESIRFADNMIVQNDHGETLFAWQERDKMSFKNLPDGPIKRKGELLVKVSANSGWNYIGIVDDEKVLKASEPVLKVSLLWICCSALACIILAVIVSKNVTKPINKLAAIMNEVESGNLEVGFQPLYTDEIGRLTINFNQMTRRLQTSIKERIEMEARHQKDQYDALTSQISSHFISNTLSSIIWLAESGKTPELIRIVDALSRMMRLTVNRGAEWIPLRSEIEQVRGYLEIQQIRYQNQFKFIMDFPLETLSCYTVKTILQPMVENAIYHGIRNKKEGGLILLSAKKEEDYLILEVKDNGGAITEEECEEINISLRKEEKPIGEHGIGLKNVHHRIRFYCKNKRCGIRLYRTENNTVCQAVLEKKGEMLHDSTDDL